MRSIGKPLPLIKCVYRPFAPIFMLKGAKLDSQKWKIYTADVQAEERTHASTSKMRAKLKNGIKI